MTCPSCPDANLLATSLISSPPSSSRTKRGGSGLTNVLPVLLSVVLMLTLAAWPGIQAAQATGPSGTMTQYGFNECFSSVGDACAVSLANPVASGDILVVAVFDYQQNYLSPPIGDTLTTSFTQVGSTPVQSLYSGGSSYLYLFYGTAPSAGTDTVTVTSTSPEPLEDIYVVEVAGASVASPGAGTGLSTSGTTAFHTSSVSFASEGFLIAFVFSGNSEGADSPTATSGFALLTAPSSGSTYNSWGEYSTGSVSSPTTFSITSASDKYAEAGIAFNQQAVPDLPLGAIPLLLVVPVIYYLGRRWRSPSTGGPAGPTSGLRQSGATESRPSTTES